jgi:hypothetical protein
MWYCTLAIISGKIELENSLLLVSQEGGLKLIVAKHIWVQDTGATLHNLVFVLRTKLVFFHRYFQDFVGHLR